MKIDEIREMPENPNRMSDEAYERLKNAIEKNNKEGRELWDVALEGKILITNHQGLKTVVAGNHRFRALRELGFETIPEHYYEYQPKMSEKKWRKILDISNVRGTLDPIKQARNLKARYHLENKDRGITKENFAKEIGMTKGTLSKIFRRLKVKGFTSELKVSILDELTILDGDKLEDAIQYAIRNKWSKMEARAFAQNLRRLQREKSEQLLGVKEKSFAAEPTDHGSPWLGTLDSLKQMLERFLEKNPKLKLRKDVEDLIRKIEKEKTETD